MKISALYVYPIKGLRGIELQKAQVGPQGIKHDRRFMLYQAGQHEATAGMKAMQLASHPQCALFEQQITSGPGGSDGEVEEASVVVRYHNPEDIHHSDLNRATPPQSPSSAEDSEATLRVPLEPDVSLLEKISVDLHGSPATAYRMGGGYDAWFSSRFGFPTVLVYIGDGRRAVLGTSMLPKAANTAAAPQKGWVSSLASLVTSPRQQQPATPAPWLTFTDVAPLLVTSESSLRDVSARLPADQPMPMFKFRPNLVVDGEGEAAWAEDFWAELAIDVQTKDLEQQQRHTLLLTSNCARCISLNVDYQTGKPAEGELGSVLKKLMKDRRVDAGTKWSPVFGRYAFVAGGEGEVLTVLVGDEVQVTRRNAERSVWDWPGL
ncbi:hypothetical protein B0T24DRAFT_615523 [Lasiosphaeria ovina]|uniref:MOSC domain-containing protein n=1 Tax=Lasiosphaeria ovina TaxID=92902 RepID=A0AAE0NFA5_9PEZI|nr:hypothetical protein B0T24DRAFT_615523 [Lasiosphaeria ovina]